MEYLYNTNSSKKTLNTPSANKNNSSYSLKLIKPCNISSSEDKKKSVYLSSLNASNINDSQISLKEKEKTYIKNNTSKFNSSKFIKPVHNPSNLFLKQISTQLKNKLNKHKQISQNNKKAKKNSLKISKNLTILLPKEKFRVIKKTNIIYDSLDDDEDEEEENKDLPEGVYINPKHFCIVCFDFFLMIFVAFYSIYFPINIAFTRKFCFIYEDTFVFSNILIVEVLCFCDFIFGFFRGFYDEKDTLILKQKEITKNYFNDSFLLDLVTAVPVYLFSIKMCGANYMYMRPVDRIVDALLCLKMLKLYKISSKNKNEFILLVKEAISKYLYLEKLTNLLFWMFCAFEVMHFTICLNIFVSKISHKNWITHIKIHDKNKTDIYIASFYSIMTTLTTVGYGDVTQKSINETVFQIFLISLGIIVYSLLVSTVGNIVRNQHKLSTNFVNNEKILTLIKQEYPAMPYELYNSVLKYLKDRNKNELKVDNNMLLSSLPYSLKNKLILSMYRDIICKFYIFKTYHNTDFVTKVLVNFIHAFAKKDEKLVEEGEDIDKIVFIKEGRVTLEISIDANNKEDSIKSYLESGLLTVTEEQLRSISVKKTRKLKFQISSFYIKQLKHELLNAFNNNTNSVSSNSEFIHINNVNPFKKKININSNLKNLKILDLKKNENYGGLFIFLNKKSPFTLKVRYKRAEIFTLRKCDAVDIAKDYPNIMKRLNQKDYKNFVFIKKYVEDLLKKYCENPSCSSDDMYLTHAFEFEAQSLRKKKQKIITNKLCSINNNIRTINSVFDTNVKTLNDLIKYYKTSNKKKPNLKGKNRLKSKINQTSIIGDSINIPNNSGKFASASSKLIQLKTINVRDIIDEEEEITNKTKTGVENKENKDNSTECRSKMTNNKCIKNNNSSNSSSNSSSNISDNTSETVKFENDDKYPTTIKDLSKEAQERINKIIHKKVKEEVDKIYKSRTFIKINNCNFLGENIMQININNKNIKKNIKKNMFDCDNLSVSTNDSFEIDSSYDNINSISNGVYAKNISLQTSTKNFIKETISNLTNDALTNDALNNDIIKQNDSIKAPSAFKRKRTFNKKTDKKIMQKHEEKLKKSLTPKQFISDKKHVFRNRSKSISHVDLGALNLSNENKHEITHNKHDITHNKHDITHKIDDILADKKDDVDIIDIFNKVNEEDEKKIRHKRLSQYAAPSNILSQKKPRKSFLHTNNFKRAKTLLHTDTKSKKSMNDLPLFHNEDK